MLKKFSSLFLVALFGSVSNHAVAQSGPPYPVYWTNQVRVNTNGSVLTKNQGPNNWGAGAISSNVLAPNTDGWMEFVGGSGAHCIVGLAANNMIDLDKFSHGIYLDQASNYYAIYEGSTTVASGSWQVGDIFKIARENNSTINYYRNGIVARSITVSPGISLQVKAAIRFPGKSTPAINTSFDGNLIIQGNVTPVVGNNTSGGVSITATGGVGPYTYSWLSGEQTNVISNKPIGSYSVTVSDAAGHVQMRTYEIGRPLY